ncbi:MAG: dephospho-CoA kinase [Paracoccaceae bacterium]
MTFKIGLTGSIGMGKSTTAAMFADEGCDVWDADAAVHRLYSKDGAAVDPLGQLYPDAIVENAVSRDVLKQIIAKDRSALTKIEKIVHPLVGQDRAVFLENAASDIVVFDIPLLFETGGDKNVDATVCVSVDPDTQAKRVLARGTMSRETFESIRAKQMPNDQKCALSDFVIITDDLEHARQQVQAVLAAIRERMHA